MSARWRKRKALESLPYETTGNAPAMGGDLDSEFSDQLGYAVADETFFPDAANTTEFSSGPVGNIDDRIDYEIGGKPGDTKAVYGMGVVSPYNVDAHDYDGGQAIIRRMPDGNYGPVGAGDYNSMLGLLYAMQETSYYYPNEQSQADIIKAV